MFKRLYKYVQTNLYNNIIDQNTTILMFQKSSIISVVMDLLVAVYLSITIISILTRGVIL